MWIQTALSSLLLVLSRASVDCKAVEIETAGLSVLYPMDSCTTTTTIANGESIHSGLVYWCDGSDPVVSAYNQANCGGSVLSTTKLSDANAGATITAYCDKSACEVITFGTVIKSTCAGQATMVSEVAWISDYCFSTYGSVSTKYTCSGDDVIISTYASSDCTGTSSDMSYANTGLEECSELQGIATATQVTCGMASFHTEATTETPETCTKGVNYAIDGAICHVWGDPHFNTWSGVRGRHDFMGQPATGKSQFYYVARCNGVSVDDMPFAIIGKQTPISDSVVSGLEYLTIELYDEDGTEYLLFLSSSIASYGTRDATTSSTLYADQSQLKSITSAVDTAIGDRFSILFTKTSNLRIVAVLTIDGTCTVELWMEASWSGMHTLYITPPECYKCFICGLCGDFKRAATSSATQRLETCSGGFVSYVAGWGPNNAFAYDLNGNSWEVSSCSPGDISSELEEEYIPDVGDDFTYVEPCDESIAQEVIDSCQTARDNAATCCDLIGVSFCDEVQDTCEFDACVVSGTDASVIDATVAKLFTAAVDLACDIPNVADLFDEARVTASTTDAETDQTALFIGGSVVFVLCITVIVYLWCRKTRVNSPDHSTKPVSVSSKTTMPLSTNQSTSSTAVTMTGWIEMRTGDGTVYYQNTATKQTQWDKPITRDINEGAPLLPSHKPIETQLPSGWIEMRTSDGAVYYQNNATKQTQWDKPTAVPITTVIPLQSSVQSAPATAIESKENGITSSTIVVTTDVNYTKQKAVDIEVCVLPTDWVEMHTNDGEVYYQNNATKQTQWDKPTAAPLSVEKPLQSSVESDAMKQDVKHFFDDMSVLEQDVQVQYFKLFIANGFDSLEIVKTISHQDLCDIGVTKLGHRKIILSKVQQL